MSPGGRRLAGITALITSVLLWSCGTDGEEVCDNPLVSSLPPSSFRSSSQLSSSHGPVFAKVNRREGAGGWSPLHSDRYQWLEVDLGRRTQITAVATQGRYGSSDWLTAYLLMFSDTGHNWRQHRQEDSLGAFPGNTNADTVVQYKLEQPVITRYLRLIPLHWNPTGRIGLRLEVYGCRYASDVASFDGSSSLVFRLSIRPRTATQTIALKFKTLKNSGTLLHAEGERDHSLNLVLKKGKLLLYHQQGVSSPSGGQLLASLGSLLDDQHWHHVKLERLSSHLNLSVDRNMQQIHVPAELSHWYIHTLSLGAVQSHGLQRPILPNRNFHGCLENLSYNDFNLLDLAKQRSPQVTAVGNVTFTCSEPVSVAVTFSDSSSFLQLPGPIWSPSGAVSITLQFRTWNKAGLLLTFGHPQLDSLFLYLSEARLRLEISKAGRTLLELSAGSALNDGQWHSVELASQPDLLSITVDKDEGATAQTSIPLPLTPDSPIFFGGCPAEGSSLEGRNPFNSFQGCMRLLTVDDQPVDLIRVQQRLLGSYSHLQIDMCGIIDRCSPSHCEHGGRCTQSWSTFHCNCSNSGYRGATCHTSTHEQSCEMYKHKGNTSGHYYIDVDGSGPIKPHLVFCNITEDKTWVVIHHNNTDLTRIQSSTERNQHFAHFDYSSEEEQLAAIISQSEHCEQQLSYHCRRSRLLNMLDGVPFSWWVGGQGPGQVQTYWGGALPGSRQCGCSLQDTCLDSSYYCNCDADHDQWYWTDDSGLITHKETLPVRSLVLGDIHRPGSQAAYRVGPLRCHGDRSFWNAAFFDRKTSYLHFPTFHGELNADISFLFKTTFASGVFLENLGVKDFIRIELSSSTEVVFSFDVGNGPLEVRVHTSFPLNDDRWHSVQVERNVKEASLRVDGFPAATQEAPTDGLIHLQLNSQLFIGGTASRQKGFLGCIRSLRMNGVTLDLEERAKITPGVRPGCPGHCSSYGSLCQNGGRCLERASGFSCSCNQSAFSGAFCHEEVSAAFKSTTSITYILEEPHELSRKKAGAPPPSIHSDPPLRGENISLSFRTSRSPALLIYVSSFYKEYLMLLINEHDKLELRYKLHSSRDVEVFSSRVMNLADGCLHTVIIRRQAKTASMQIDQNAREDFSLTSDVEFNNIASVTLGRLQETDGLDVEMPSLGFIGCLSGVQFNSISPLKAALLHPDSRVIVSGPLVESNCASSSLADPYAAETTRPLSDQPGSGDPGQPLVDAIRSDSALIGGVIAVGIFVTASALAVLAKLIRSRKETYQNQEVKAAQPDDCGEFPFSSHGEYSQ